MLDDDQNAPGAAADRAAWVPEDEWKLFDQYTTSSYAGGQLRVATYSSRKDPPRIRVWAQLWARVESVTGGAVDFVPTELVLALESDLTRLVEKIIRERRSSDA